MSAQEQVNFLLCCIKHGVAGGKVDFEAVAKELNITTKAAAAKRYERLKKRAMTGDFTGTGGNDDGDSSVVGTPKTPRSRAVPSTPGSSKRKRNGNANGNRKDDNSDENADLDTETPDGKTDGDKPCANVRPKRQKAEEAAHAIKQEAELEEAETIAEQKELGAVGMSHADDVKAEAQDSDASDGGV